MEHPQATTRPLSWFLAPDEWEELRSAAVGHELQEEPLEPDEAELVPVAGKWGLDARPVAPGQARFTITKPNELVFGLEVTAPASHADAPESRSTFALVADRTPLLVRSAKGGQRAVLSFPTPFPNTMVLFQRVAVRAPTGSRVVAVTLGDVCAESEGEGGGARVAELLAKLRAATATVPAVLWSSGTGDAAEDVVVEQGACSLQMYRQ